MGLIKIPSTRNTSKYKQVLEYEYKFIENLLKIYLIGKMKKINLNFYMIVLEKCFIIGSLKKLIKNLSLKGTCFFYKL